MCGAGGVAREHSLVLGSLDHLRSLAGSSDISQDPTTPKENIRVCQGRDCGSYTPKPEPSFRLVFECRRLTASTNRTHEGLSAAIPHPREDLESRTCNLGS